MRQAGLRHLPLDGHPEPLRHAPRALVVGDDQRAHAPQAELGGVRRARRARPPSRSPCPHAVRSQVPAELDELARPRSSRRDEPAVADQPAAGARARPRRGRMPDVAVARPAPRAIHARACSSVKGAGSHQSTSGLANARASAARIVGRELAHDEALGLERQGHLGAAGSLGRRVSRRRCRRPTRSPRPSRRWRARRCRARTGAGPRAARRRR